MYHVTSICAELEVSRGEELNDFFIWVLLVVWSACKVFFRDASINYGDANSGSYYFVGDMFMSFFAIYTMELFQCWSLMACPYLWNHLKEKKGRVNNPTEPFSEEFLQFEQGILAFTSEITWKRRKVEISFKRIFGSCFLFLILITGVEGRLSALFLTKANKIF